MCALHACGDIPVRMGSVTIFSTPFPEHRHWGISEQAVSFAIYVYGVWKFVALGITNGGMTGADVWMARSDDAQPWWEWGVARGSSGRGARRRGWDQCGENKAE